MSFLSQPLILADVAPNPGYTKNFNYCFKITNLDKYPKHLLFTQIGSVRDRVSTEPYLLVKAGQCIPIKGYMPLANITAIAKNKVQRKDLQTTSSGTILKNTKLQKSLVQGTPTIYPPNALPIINEGKTIEANFKIQSIDSKGLKLAPVDNPVSMLNIVLFPLIGTAIIGGLIWNRQRNLVKVK
jgi:hypothetical protein